MNRLEAFRRFFEPISPTGIHRSNHGSVCHRHLAITLVALVLALFITSSCSSTDHTRLAKSATTDTAEVFVQPAFGTDLRTKIAVIPFQAPSNAQQAGQILTETYYQELLRGGGFRQVTLVRELPPTQRHLPAWQVLKDYDLVLQGEIIHLLTGTGSTPTQLQVEIRIVDVARGTMAWYVKQQCVSRPGEDLDLILKTVPGEYAKPYQELASVLARKFVQIITTMPEKPPETFSEPPLGAQTPSGTGR
jgi:hypothetical protein